MAKYTKEQVMQMVRENNVRFIRLQFTDILGSLKNVAITDKQLEKALKNDCMFDGSSIEGFVRIEESDMRLYPDLDSFVIYPWTPKEHRIARLICNVYRPDHTPFEGDPRNVLIRALDHAAENGVFLQCGTGAGIFPLPYQMRTVLLRRIHTMRPVILTSALWIWARRPGIAICLALEEMGFEIEASHHECAPGQHEIDFKYAEALTAADDIVTFKLAVKTIAQKHKLHATFMPKPLFGVAGNGMHTNMSLFKDGKNAFYDPDEQFGLSTEALQFIAGVLDHAKGITAIANPLVNSYKRLVPGYEAPVYIAWSARNRSPLIRVPAARGNSTRVELRSPDPSCNPYLLLALVLRAGLDGIERGLMPPLPVDGNIYHMSEEERIEKKVGNLPGTLDEAIQDMVNDPLMREALGDHVFNKYVTAKRLEFDKYRVQVHQWEVDRYLTQY